MANTRKPKRTRHSSAVHEFRFLVPRSVILLCKVLDVSPEQLVRDFVDLLAFSSWKRAGKDKLRLLAVEYIMECKYGQEFFCADDIRQMFTELDAIGLLYPKDGDEDTIDEYAKFRDGYYKYWFDKWFNKYRRKTS